VDLVKKLEAPPIARGPGPRWFRFGLVAIALVYYGALVHHPPDSKWVRPASFFTDATCLFPKSDVIAQEYRLEVWVCGQQWALIDPQPYFPIRTDDKESRLQRLGFFYNRSRPVMQALDAYVSAGHAAGLDDGVTGRIGGIRLVRVERSLPAPGDPVERYHFDPRAPIPPEQRHDVYFTPESQRKRRCSGS
jgi:hypothetical protein